MDASSPLPGNRRFLHGTRQIIEFNWPRFAASGAIILGGLFLASIQKDGPVKWVVVVGVALAAWWMVASVVASWWIYDATSLTTWRWLPQVVGRPYRWANVHAGFDETTNALNAVFPSSIGRVVDIYDPAVTSEASIARARKGAVPAPPAQRGSWRSLPLDSESQDAVFFLFAAHELRRHEQRVALFREAARVLTENGSIILVEHLRDAANLMVFGPGFFHFLPRRAWMDAAAEAGLSVKLERALNHFVVLFVLEKES